MAPHFCLGDAFDEVVRQHSERPALVYPRSARSVRYSELAELADRIAGRFLAVGLKSRDVVGIFHDKSPEAYACMLACLKLGLVYTNLDPVTPEPRLNKILDTCQPCLVVNFTPDIVPAQRLTSLNIPVFLIGDLLQEREKNLVPAQAAVGSNSAYIMFTSGSTGTPKGAVISHANLLWFITWLQKRFSVNATDVFSNLNPMYFDNSVFDFYGALFSGAALVPVTQDELRSPKGVVELLDQAGCTLWFSVPSLLVYMLTTRAFAESSMKAMRAFIFGGEGFPKSKLKQLYDLFGSRCVLENVYGPTECTCICSAYSISGKDFEDMQTLAPLGMLAENFQYRILPVAEDNPSFGELMLLGPQVGLGYYNDFSRTAASFVQNPSHSVFPEVGYLTGDLVEEVEGGILHFKGRKDYQIKHMGYRIELEEIETVLSSIPGVVECAVIYRKSMAEEVGQIVAYAATEPTVSQEEIPGTLSLLLPYYMRPKNIFFLNHLPKNANGKIDRKALQSFN